MEGSDFAISFITEPRSTLHVAYPFCFVTKRHPHTFYE